LSAATVAPRELPQRLKLLIFSGLSSGTGGRIFFGSFLLARQKKGTHRQVKSLLSGLLAKVKMVAELEHAGQRSS
jgi:hypothetical protein